MKEININIDSMVDGMVNWGIKVGDIVDCDFRGWTDTFMDVIQEKFNLETLVIERMQEIHKENSQWDKEDNGNS